MLAASVPAPVHPGQRLAPPARRHVRLRLWLPLTPLFWLLSPLALFFAPIVWLGTPRRTRNPYVWAVVIGRLLVSLGGLLVDIDAPGVRLFIRIF